MNLPTTYVIWHYLDRNIYPFMIALLLGMFLGVLGGNLLHTHGKDKFHIKEEAKKAKLIHVTVISVQEPKVQADGTTLKSGAFYELETGERFFSINTYGAAGESFLIDPERLDRPLTSASK